MKSTASHLSVFKVKLILFIYSFTSMRLGPRKSIKRLTTRPPTIRNRAPSSGVLTTDSKKWIVQKPFVVFYVLQQAMTMSQQHHLQLNKAPALLGHSIMVGTIY